MKKILFSLLFNLLLLLSGAAFAQSVYAPLNRDYEHLVERYEIKSGQWAAGMHTHVKPYLRQRIVQLVDTAAQNNNFLSTRDQFNLAYLRDDSWEWVADSLSTNSQKPILKGLYRKRSDFFSFRNPDVEVHLNPVLYLGTGKDNLASYTPFTNTRGVELRGSIDKKVGFYGFFTETQLAAPLYVKQYTDTNNAFPGENYYRPFAGRPNAVDFVTARGYFIFNATRHIQVQFGHDRNVIGNGYRSMILSDFGANYLFLKLSTNIWRFNYTNIFAQLTAGNQSVNGRGYPRKYFTFHHLSVNLGKRFNLGIFEAIVSGLPDSLGGSRLNAEYLNPIIFYRALELNTGSNDGNALLGLDMKWQFLRHVQVYGQLVLDEFVLSEIRARRGYWANKQAGQLGIKYIDAFGVPNLDLQAEFNIARPFTYSHTSAFTNYTHYNQPLAHPIGANFSELVGIVRYQPINRLSLIGKLIYTVYGDDIKPYSNGRNVLLSYNTRQNEYGYTIGNGTKTTLIYADLRASFMLRHNIFIDFQQVLRRLESAIEVRTQNTAYTAIALRWNIPYREAAF